MAWTAPATWTASQIVTAADLNTQLRDNMLQTAPALVTTAGDIVRATGANALARLGIGATNAILSVAAGIPAWVTSLTIPGTSGNVLIVDTNTLVVDATNDRVGIGTASPADILHLVATSPQFYIQRAAISNAAVLRFRTGTTEDWRIGTGIVATGSDLEFTSETGATLRMKLHVTGQLKLAGSATRSTTEGTNHLDIFNGTAPVGTLTNGVSLYSAAGELWVMDSAGNATLLSDPLVLTSGSADVTTSETTSSTTYTDLATSGPAVTLSPGATQNHLITISSRMEASLALAISFVSVAIAGATALDVNAAEYETADANAGSVLTRLTRAASIASGSTHTMKYRVGSNVGTFANRRIIVLSGV